MSSSPFGALNCCLLSPHGCPFTVGSEFLNLLMFHLHVLYPYLEDSFGLTINQFIVLMSQVACAWSAKSTASKEAWTPTSAQLMTQQRGQGGPGGGQGGARGGPGGGPGGGQGGAKGGTRELPRCFFQFLHNLLTTVKVTANKEDPRGKRWAWVQNIVSNAKPNHKPNFLMFCPFSPPKEERLGEVRFFLLRFTVVYHICRWSWYAMGTRQVLWKRPDAARPRAMAEPKRLVPPVMMQSLSWVNCKPSNFDVKDNYTPFIYIYIYIHTYNIIYIYPFICSKLCSNINKYPCIVYPFIYPLCVCRLSRLGLITYSMNT